MPPALTRERLEQLRYIVASWTDDERLTARAALAAELRAIDVEQAGVLPLSTQPAVPWE